MIRKRLSPTAPKTGHDLLVERDQTELAFSLAVVEARERRNQEIENLRTLAQERQAAVTERLAHLEDEARVLADLV